LLHVDRAPLTF
jgi:methionine synthase II (cobalamin-independent)